MTKSGVRVTAQDRSANRQRQISNAAVRVIAERGLAGVTHRLVARNADVSLAATTYYYRTKSDIIADASGQFLAGYVNDIGQRADRIVEQAKLCTFGNLVARLIREVACGDRVSALALGEIELGAARHPDLRQIVRESFRGLRRIWLRSPQLLAVQNAAEIARSANDLFVGLNFVILALGVTEEQARAALEESTEIYECWKPPAVDLVVQAGVTTPTQTTRAQRTRDRILDAAIDLLIAGGPAAVTFRSVADRLGLTAAAPTHHFPKLELLLAATHERMFALSKERQRENVTRVDYRRLNIENLVDFISTLFIREATQSAALNTASYTLWLEAARRPDLRATVWNLFNDQCRAWQRLLDHMAERYHTLDPVILHSLFMGKLIRILSTGSTTIDLAQVRREFAFDISGVLAGHHWMTAAAD